MWSDEARQAAADARKGSGSKEPAHQSRIAKLVSEFGKSESGSGKIPKALEEFDIRHKSPAEIGRIGKEVAAGISEGRLDLHSLIHFAHFLGMLACIALADLIVLGLSHVVR